MLENVLLGDFLAVAKTIPHPDLVKEDTLKFALTDSEFVRYQLAIDDETQPVGTLHHVTLKKSWTSKGVAWVFA